MKLSTKKNKSSYIDIDDEKAHENDNCVNLHYTNIFPHGYIADF